MPLYLTVAQAAAEIGRSKRYVQRLAAEGR